MSIIVTAAVLGNAKIGYKNLFTTSGVTVTASTEASTYEKENGYDGFGYDWWKPTATGDSWLRASFASAQTVNYMAVWGHDLADQGSSVKPQYSTDAGVSWTDAASAVAPSTNRTLFFSFSDIAGADWRCLVNNPTTIAAIAGIQIGAALDLTKSMEVGFAPPTLAPIIKSKTAQSETGAFIGGRKLSEGIRGSFTLTTLSPAWVRSDWQPFIDHIQLPKTFVFAWDTVTNSTEVVHAWAAKQVPSPRYSSPLYMDITLNFEGNL